MGKLWSYSREVADRLCDELAKSGSLRAVCRMDGMPDRTTVMRWVVEDVDGFAAKYARAKDLGIDEFVEETIEIADAAPPSLMNGGVDGGYVSHAKVRIETRRWLAERMAPKKYGVKQGLDVTNSDGSLTVDDATRSARVAQLFALAQQRKAEDDHGDLA